MIKILNNLKNIEIQRLEENFWKRISFYAGLLCFFLVIISAFFKVSTASLFMIMGMIFIIFSSSMEIKQIAEFAFGLQGFRIRRLVKEADDRIQYLEKFISMVTPTHVDFLLFYYIASSNYFREDIKTQFDEAIELLCTFGKKELADNLKNKWRDGVLAEYIHHLKDIIQTVGEARIDLSEHLKPYTYSLSDIKEAAKKCNIHQNEKYLYWLEHFEYYSNHGEHKNLEEYRTKVHIRVLI